MRNWLTRAAELRPDRTAIEFQGRALSYRELRDAAVADSAGVSAAERVVLPGDDPLKFARSLHAALHAGAVVMPLDPRLTSDEINQRTSTPFNPPAGAATLMFTSGTTSRPKPVYLTDSNWEANAIGSALALGLDQHERWLCTMPLAHVGGLSILLRSTLYATTVVLYDGFDTNTVVGELLDPERGITLVSLVPTMLARLLDAGLRAPPTLRWVLLGGGPIPPALLKRAEQAGVPVAPSYGMTETCSQLATFGRPLYGNEIRFDAGEVVVRGRSVAPLSADPDGWLRTGDLGHLDSQGLLVIDGRKSETIISGGENIVPDEVEAALLEHPAVADAGVYAIPHPEWGEAVAAKVVLRPADGGDSGPQATVTEQTLKDFARETLAPFKVPKQISFTDALPRTRSGKLLRREL